MKLVQNSLPDPFAFSSCESDWRRRSTFGPIAYVPGRQLPNQSVDRIINPFFELKLNGRQVDPFAFAIDPLRSRPLENHAIDSKIGLLPDQIASSVKCEHFRCRSGKDRNVTGLRSRECPPGLPMQYPRPRKHLRQLPIPRLHQRQRGLDYTQSKVLEDRRILLSCFDPKLGNALAAIDRAPQIQQRQIVVNIQPSKRFVPFLHHFSTESQAKDVEQPLQAPRDKKFLRPFNGQFIYFRQKICTDASNVAHLPLSRMTAPLTLPSEMADNCRHVYSCEASPLSLRRPVDHALLRPLHRRRGTAADGRGVDALPLHGLRDAGRGLPARHLAPQHAADGIHHRPKPTGSMART